MSTPEQSKDFVTSLSRGIEVIRSFDAENQSMTLSQVAERTGFSRATARRFLFTLQTLGYVQGDGKNFSLAPKILQLGYAYLSSQPIVDAVQPFIDNVSKATGESCSVSVIDGYDVVYIARHLTHHIMSVSLNIGTRLPAVTTSMGRMILSAMDDHELDDFIRNAQIKKYTDCTLVDRTDLKNQIRQDGDKGYSIVDQELEIGLRSVAVPIRNMNGKIVASMNVSTQSERVSEAELMERILPVLQSTADQIQEVIAP